MRARGIHSAWLVLAALLVAPAAGPAGDREVLEEIIARVNNEVITRADLERSRQLLRQELGQRVSSRTELERLYSEQEPNLLRDLIDQSLLVQHGNDMGLSVEAEVIKRLDQIRQEMKLDSMEALERAMGAQGINIQDYKQELRNHMLTQMVVQREVSGKVFVDSEKVRQYYLTRREELAQPERVRLREILVSTEKFSPAELPAREERARELLAKIRKGEKFEDLAREYSDAPTGAEGGELGYFEPDKLAPTIREAVSKLNINGVCDAIQTQQGWLVLQLVERRAAGVPPLEEAEDEIRNRLFMDEVQPALREFLGERRREAFIYVKPGYQDTAAVEPDELPVRRGSRRGSRRRRD
ncbi:MAG: peptidylprolyl isomerase [Candidatus Acidiferrales bacterium]